MTATAPRQAAQSRENGAIELVRFMANPLSYLDSLHGDERDVIAFKLGSLPVHLVAEPALIKAALDNEDWPPLSRGRLIALQRWCPEGIVAVTGAEHHRQRDELWGPLAADRALLDIAVARARRRADTWVEGQPMDMYDELRAICWGADWEAWTGTDLDAAPDLMQALRLGFDALAWLVLPLGAARWSLSRRTREARDRLDGVVTAMIAERRAHPRADLLGKLVEISERTPTTDEQIRATFKIWFGTSLQHALLTWSLLLLARDSEVEARWHDELQSVLGDRPATAADVPALALTTRILHEALRLFPPSWVFFRALTGDYRLGDHTLPGGGVMAVSPWFTHRDPRYWSDAARFDPDRWLGSPPPELAYFPFSAGPYGCHGPQLALSESALVLATLGQRWMFLPAAPEPKPAAAWAIEPRGGARMKPVPLP